MIYGHIYEILNIKNGKSYRGGSIRSKQRWYEHRSSLRNNRHRNQHLQNAWNKYGEEVFEFKVLYEANTKEQLDNLETFYVATGGYYNIRNGGGNRGNLSLETRKKLSEHAKGRKHSPETIEKISERMKGENNPNYGKPRAAKTKRKISEGMKGKTNAKGHKQSPEHKRKTSERRKDYWARMRKRK